MGVEEIDYVRVCFWKVRERWWWKIVTKNLVLGVYDKIVFFI